jgi:TolA-binding protein
MIAPVASLAIASVLVETVVGLAGLLGVVFAALVLTVNHRISDVRDALSRDNDHLRKQQQTDTQRLSEQQESATQRLSEQLSELNASIRELARETRERDLRIREDLTDLDFRVESLGKPRRSDR